ncbi:TRAP transporter substrate-binding protein DctP [Ureibacillus manganicus]|uniref:C4-dicarboxylate ABC transporter substrate-binding protein n=1 Tax=Ureibacillus manganicus DSM 26584 TaxID=1384049 RepID=A0A0A3HWK9_9BACL|nr:TRAP transporter substrate-binding protein DctP [Ureibacillus manganicus]KGR74738.1 hypothetical protein CD29_18570 [Ureibacillus manganicus DSM 26584]
MKKWFVAFVTILSVIVLAACGNNQTNTSNSSNTNNGTSGETNNSTTEEVFVFKSTIQAPKTASLSKGFDAYLDLVEEKSSGRIKFERYYGDALVKPADVADAVGAGIADVAVVVPSYTPAANPLSTIESLPALWNDQWTGTRALMDLYEEFPELGAEFESRNISILGGWALPSYRIVSKTDVDSFEDLKNLKVIASGSQALLAEAFGAVSVGVTMPESFEAMERGAVDGGLLGYTSSSTYGIHEIAGSVWELPIGSQGGLFGMNTAKYNQLPDELKQVFKDAALQNAIDFHKIYQTEGETEAKQKYLDAGVKINEATPEHIAQLQQIAEDAVWKKWVEERSGKPAQEILDRFRELIKKYDQEYQANGGVN